MMIRIRMIGEISSPPRLGRKERIGASSGSVMRYRTSATDATNWLRVFTTLKAISQDRIADAIRSQTYRSRTMMTMSRIARMWRGLARRDNQLDIGSDPGKQVKFPAKWRPKSTWLPFLTWPVAGL